MASTGSLLSISQIVQRLSPALAETILTHVQTEERETFAATMGLVSEVMKFRPAIWKTWPKARQREWLWTNLRQARLADTARQILQTWYFSRRAAMMNQFLDALGLAHDKDGYITGDLPEELDTGKVRAAVDALLKDFPGEEVALYLHLFQYGRAQGWAEIATLLGTDTRLQLG